MWLCQWMKTNIEIFRMRGKVDFLFAKEKKIRRRERKMRKSQTKDIPSIGKVLSNNIVILSWLRCLFVYLSSNIMFKYSPHFAIHANANEEKKERKKHTHNRGEFKTYWRTNSTRCVIISFRQNRRIRFFFSFGWRCDALARMSTLATYV